MPHQLPLSAQIDIEVWAEQPDDSPYDYADWVQIVHAAGNQIIREDAANRRVLVAFRKDA